MFLNFIATLLLNFILFFFKIVVNFILIFKKVLGGRENIKYKIILNTNCKLKL